jgi:hypothetical protein
MKQGTTALVAMAATLVCVCASNAQPLPPMSGPPVHYDTRAHYDGRALPPPYVYAPDPAMPSYEVAAILRSRGFLPMSGPVRRGDYYIVSAMHENGERGRVVINAFSGRFIEFVPASQVAVAPPRRDEMVLVYQGPTFPPPGVGRVAPLPAPIARGVPRPPASIPRVASRAPAAAPLVTPKPRPQGAPQKPESAQAPPVPAPVETRPAATSPPLVPKALEKVLPPPVVQPTQPLPPVQTME